jgi:hypothetical protein
MVSNHRLVLFTHALCRLSYPAVGGKLPDPTAAVCAKLLTLKNRILPQNRILPPDAMPKPADRIPIGCGGAIDCVSRRNAPFMLRAARPHGRKPARAADAAHFPPRIHKTESCGNLLEPWATNVRCLITDGASPDRKPLLRPAGDLPRERRKDWGGRSSGGGAMPSETNLNLYESYAQDCVRAADRMSDPQYRELLLKLAGEWMQAAARQASTQAKP